MPIPYAVDPSLHASPPGPRRLDDGFHPPSPEPGTPEPAEPNTSHLPVEPEFAPEWRPAEPEDPGTKPPLP